MKHTPGNWKIGNCSSVITDIIRNHNDAIDFYHEDAIAFYGGELICESIQNENDACLIAAAPELLQALELAIRFLDHPEVKAIPFALPIEGVIMQARVAIAKAKGES